MEMKYDNIVIFRSLIIGIGAMGAMGDGRLVHEQCHEGTSHLYKDIWSPEICPATLTSQQQLQ